ncbi:hypothetical protein N0V90_004833 [Kalmusia sp. IMI 367209]|nr:hypothetical protein N0V90_004833 [Kalmusia sp. IMI 367209]
MSASATAHAQTKLRSYLAKLERWVRRNVEGGAKSISGDGADVTLADIALMAMVQYMKESYGRNWFRDYRLLRQWCERAKGEKWYVGKEELVKCEEDGWGRVLEK